VRQAVRNIDEVRAILKEHRAEMKLGITLEFLIILDNRYFFKVRYRPQKAVTQNKRGHISVTP
jgi:hypothetical protein